jgi:hypothetical protein
VENAANIRVRKKPMMMPITASPRISRMNRRLNG